MMVTIELFGAHSLIAEAETMTMPVDGGATAADALEFINNRHPDLRLEKNSVLVTVNRTLAALDSPLRPGDVVSFLPPIGGG